MNLHNIEQLMASLSVSSENVQLEESHISWVILTPKFVYKIPKPVQLPYLDFRTLENRQLYCEKEIKLNRLLTTDVYLEVVAIRQVGQEVSIGGQEGIIIDYAIKMKRLPSERLMSKLLKNDKVQNEQILAIADQLIPFHSKAEQVTTPPDINKMKEDFADLLSVKTIIAKYLGIKAARQIEEWVYDAKKFLDAHETRIIERFHKHFYIFFHGDLHSENIFITEKPIIFDCIAFNDTFRHGDILNELAFFYMDMDAYDRADLGELFLQRYLQQSSCMETEEDQLIFLYYKLYRANIRLKVNAIKVQQAVHSAEKSNRVTNVKIYFDLMNYYHTISNALNYYPFSTPSQVQIDATA